MDGVERELAICPHCRAPLRVSAETLEAIIRELELWDRRFDGADTIAANILSVISDQGSD